ncbi:MAG: 4-hydroxy-tetrahydrodipicolinate synthase [Syntrophomonadaceae bacterium]|nr:4-hydroxy-tetrahydrodipicolinate synthase [Syntrophomonadaceae bacterium]
MKDFGRVLTAMVTPLDRDGRLDLDQARDLAVYLVNNGSDGLVVTGTTGESPTLTQEEKLQLYAAVLEAVKGKASVIAGTGSNSTASTIELTMKAEKLGVDGIMLVTPYYNKPTQEGMYQHFQAVAEKTQLPIILYNVPGRTSSNLLPSTVARLAQLPNIVAIKEASGSLDQVSELMGLLPDDFVVYSGDDSLTLPLLALGAYGIISVASHVAGREIQEMVQAFVRGEMQRARSLHLKLFPLYKAMFIVTNPIPVKMALNLIGHPVGPPRLPLVEASPVEAEAIRVALSNFGLLSS